MNTIIGDGQMQIGDALRPYYIGTRQTAIYCELQNCDLKDVQRVLMEVGINQHYAAKAAEVGEPYEPTGRKSLTGAETRDFLYAALAAGAKREGLPVDFTADEVSDWIDEAEIDEVQKPFNTHFALAFARLEANAARQPKKAPAPAATRGTKAKVKKKD